MGVGCIGQSTGEKPYKAVIYPRVQFKEPTNEYDTKQEQVSFTHTTLEGDFYTMEDGVYSIKAGFDSEAEAKAFINEKFAIQSASGGETGSGSQEDAG